MLLIYGLASERFPVDLAGQLDALLAMAKPADPGAMLIDAAILSRPDTASTVRVRNSEPRVSKGPVTSTDAPLMAYGLIEVGSPNTAIAIAEELQSTIQASIEVRPVFQLDGLPAEKLGTLTSGRELQKYIFLCHDDEDAWKKAGPEALSEAMREAVALAGRLDDMGLYLAASPLEPSTTARTLRSKNGQRIVTSGPFTETREVLGGYYLILAADQRQAIEYATQHSGARVGAVEVRQVCTARRSE